MSAQEIVDSRFGAVVVERVDVGRTLRVSGEAIPTGSMTRTGGMRRDKDSVELGVVAAGRITIAAHWRIRAIRRFNGRTHRHHRDQGVLPSPDTSSISISTQYC